MGMSFSLSAREIWNSGTILTPPNRCEDQERQASKNVMEGNILSVLWAEVHAPSHRELD
jgi:hypothetical protein